MIDTYSCGHKEERRNGVMMDFNIPNPCLTCTEKQKEGNSNSFTPSTPKPPQSVPVRMPTTKQIKLVDLCKKYPGRTLEILMLQDLWNKKLLIPLLLYGLLQDYPWMC